MIAMHSIPTSLKLALAALALAGIFLGWSLYRAMNPTPVGATELGSLPAVVTPQPLGSQRTAQISRAVDIDPFSPERKRPAVRYRLAHEVAEEGGPPQRTQLRWAGVILAPDPANSILSVALGNNNNAPVTPMKVGEALGGYTLMSFDRASASFQSESGELLTILNPRPGIR